MLRRLLSCIKDKLNYLVLFKVVFVLIFIYFIFKNLFMFKGVRILVVEDDLNLGFFLMEFLEGVGY